MLMFPNSIFILMSLLLKINLLSSLELYVSSSATMNGDGTFLNPYQNISQTFQNSAIQGSTSFLIFLLSNYLSYVINTPMKIICNTSFVFNNNQMAVLDFQFGGSLYVNEYFSLNFENLTLKQSGQTDPQNNSAMIQAENANCLCFKVYSV